MKRACSKNTNNNENILRVPSAHIKLKCFRMKSIFQKMSLLLIAISFFACSKYEEGPLISLKSPEKRLLGLWEITELMANDTNLVSAYRDSLVYVKFSIIQFDNMFINIVREGGSGAQMSSSVLELVDNKKKMKFGLTRLAFYEQYTAPLYELIPPLEFENQWTIVRLHKREFIISLSNEGVEYKLTFERLE